AANSEVVVAAYDAGGHVWVATDSARVSGDGRSILVSIARTGQIACLAPDDAPFTPPPAQVGSPIVGVAAAPLPAGVTATGEVLPRSAPPGDQARATGRVLLQHVAALPSGAVVQARVSETFDLTDQSQVAPPSFTEDIVLYARGRPAGVGVLGAS